MSGRRMYAGEDSRPARRKVVSPQKKHRKTRRKDDNVIIMRRPGGSKDDLLRKLQLAALAANPGTTRVPPLPPLLPAQAEASEPPASSSAQAANGSAAVDSSETMEIEQGGWEDEEVTVEHNSTRRPAALRSSGISERTSKYYSNWQSILPRLMDPLLEYWNLVDGGRRPPPPISPPAPCSKRGCALSPRQVLCISQDSESSFIYSVSR